MNITYLKVTYASLRLFLLDLFTAGEADLHFLPSLDDLSGFYSEAPRGTPQEQYVDIITVAESSIYGWHSCIKTTLGLETMAIPEVAATIVFKVLYQWMEVQKLK